MLEVFITYLIDKIRQWLPGFSNRLEHVTTYVRYLPINLDRMYENAIDGEHLPHLHSSTFSFIEIQESGKWGWRAKAGLQPSSRFNQMEIELKLDREQNCWKTVTLSGLGKGTEIWTHAIPTGDNQIKVVVDFFVPKLPRFLVPIFGPRYLEVYTKLYDEDLSMMQGRQEALDYLEQNRKSHKLTSINDSENKKSLGTKTELMKLLPFGFEYNKARYVLVEHKGELLAFTATCPHMLGPLDEGRLENGIVECPWHGYKFDIVSGKATNGHNCNLKPGPKVFIDSSSQEVYVSSNN